MSHLPLKLTKVSSLGVTRICDIMPTFDGSAYKINLAKLNIRSEDGSFIRGIEPSALQRFRRVVKKRPLEISMHDNGVLDKVVPISGRNRTVCVLTDIEIKTQNDESQVVIGKISPYGDMKSELTDFLRSTVNGVVVIRPVLCGRKYENNEFSVESFNRFELMSLYTSPEPLSEDAVLRENDENQLTIE